MVCNHGTVTVIHLSERRNFDLTRFLGTIYTTLHIILHRKCWKPQICSHFLWNKYKQYELDLPYIFFPKMHKNPYTHRFIASSAKNQSRSLEVLLNRSAYSRSLMNQVLILQNSKELLEHLKSPVLNHMTRMKSFDFSTRDSTIPHEKLQSKLARL